MEKNANDLPLLRFLKVQAIELLESLQVVLRLDDCLEDGFLDICDHVVLLGDRLDLVRILRVLLPVSRGLP